MATFRNIDQLAKEKEESDKKKKDEDSIIWKQERREFQGESNQKQQYYKRE